VGTEPHRPKPQAVSREEREEIAALVELVKFDYEHTLSFIDGVVRVSTSIRTIATAGWFALIAAAVQTDESMLAVLAGAGAVTLGLQDAYHGWLYAEGRKRAHRMEGLLEDYYKYLQRVDRQPSTATELLKKLHNHRFGQRSNVPALGKPSRPLDPSVQESNGEESWWTRAKSRAESAARALSTILTEARPKFFYRWLYLPLVLLAVLVAILISVDNGSKESAEGDPGCAPPCQVDPSAENPPQEAQGGPGPRSQGPRAQDRTQGR
jgi:hypothetical protein